MVEDIGVFSLLCGPAVGENRHSTEREPGYHGGTGCGTLSSPGCWKLSLGKASGTVRPAILMLS